MDLSLAAIRTRTSVRSYDGKALDPPLAMALEAAFEEALPTPFGHRPRFALLSASAAGLGSEEGRESRASGKIGTYGLIRNAPAFIVGAVESGPFALEDFGYALEGIILRAAELGLGTCWIGGLFDRGQVRRLLGLGDGELLPAIVSVGAAADRMSLAERLTRFAARPESRRAFGELFFDGAFGRPLSAQAAGPWAEVLEAVRWSPSASNKQPWRILRQGSPEAPLFHLYLDEDRIYNNALGPIHIQNIDQGIAMRHFEAAARSLGLPGGWRRREAVPAPAPASSSYTSTWEQV